MRARKLTGTLLPIVVFLVCVALAQEPKQVSGEEAMQHVTKRVEAKYPGMAEMAHIQGIVIVRATIDERGKVIETKPITGHPMLLDAAEIAVRYWEFQPFLENGTPVRVQAPIKVEFLLGPGAELRASYLQKEVECTKQIQNKKFSESEAACKQALEIALKLPRSFETDKMRAYGNLGTAEYNGQNGPAALEAFQHQLEYAKQALQPGSPQMIQVHSNLAHAYQATDHLPETDAEYTETEKSQEAAQAALESRRDQMKPEAFNGIKASYDHNLRTILQEHIAVLRKMGKIKEAQALELKAAVLMDSH